MNQKQLTDLKSLLLGKKIWRLSISRTYSAKNTLKKVFKQMKSQKISHYALLNNIIIK